MITQKDIQNIITAEREVFATKQELSEMREEMRTEFSTLTKAVDAYSQKAETFFQELVMTNHKVERHEKWLHQIAEKLNVKLEY